MTGSSPPARGAWYWAPRLFVVGSVLAMVLPAPDFVDRLSRDERVLWWAEVVWVLSLPAAFVAVLLGVWHLTRRLGGKRR